MMSRTEPRPRRIAINIGRIRRKMAKARMGNFCAMYATIYLGQTVGFPLTQLCLVVNGLWGILWVRQGVSSLDALLSGSSMWGRGHGPL